jgi:hypothetical protein
MKNQVVETTLESRKEWVLPELKKVDIEQVTAGGITAGGDGQNGS